MLNIIADHANYMAVMLSNARDAVELLFIVWKMLNLRIETLWITLIIILLEQNLAELNISKMWNCKQIYYENMSP